MRSAIERRAPRPTWPWRNSPAPLGPVRTQRASSPGRARARARAWRFTLAQIQPSVSGLPGAASTPMIIARRVTVTAERAGVGAVERARGVDDPSAHRARVRRRYDVGRAHPGTARHACVARGHHDFPRHRAPARRRAQPPERVSGARRRHRHQHGPHARCRGGRDGDRRPRRISTPPATRSAMAR